MSIEVVKYAYFKTTEGFHVISDVSWSMKAHKFVVLEIHGKSFVSEHHFSTTVRMFCIDMRIMLFVDTYRIFTVETW